MAKLLAVALKRQQQAQCKMQKRLSIMGLESRVGSFPRDFHAAC